MATVQFVFNSIIVHAFTTALPRFSPLKSPMNASNILSKPSVTCSLYFILPWEPEKSSEV